LGSREPNCGASGSAEGRALSRGVFAGKLEKGRRMRRKSRRGIKGKEKAPKDPWYSLIRLGIGGKEGGAEEKVSKVN